MHCWLDANIILTEALPTPHDGLYYQSHNRLDSVLPNLVEGLYISAGEIGHSE